MNKFFARAVLAMTVATITAHEASAWVNSKFGVGLSWCWQSGGNNILGGLFQNGQPPAPDCGVGCGPGPAPCLNGNGMFPPAPYQGFGAPVPPPPAPLGAVQGRTQSQTRVYYSGQTVNRQYPYGSYNGYSR